MWGRQLLGRDRSVRAGRGRPRVAEAPMYGEAAIPERARDRVLPSVPRGDGTRWSCPSQVLRRGAGLERDAHRAGADARQVHRGVLGARGAENRYEVTLAHGVAGVVPPLGGHRADAFPQFAVGDRVEALQEAQRGTARIRVGDRLRGTLAQGGPRTPPSPWPRGRRAAGQAAGSPRRRYPGERRRGTGDPSRTGECCAERYVRLTDRSGASSRT